MGTPMSVSIKLFVLSVVMMSTEVEDILPRQSFFSAILPYCIIAFLIYLIRQIMKCKKCVLNWWNDH